jgi:hypothetical protein
MGNVLGKSAKRKATFGMIAANGGKKRTHFRDHCGNQYGASQSRKKSLLAGWFIVESGIWRRGSGSNRRKRLCRPLHNHFATPPGVMMMAYQLLLNDC